MSVQIYPDTPGPLMVYTSTVGMSHLCKTKLNQLKCFGLHNNLTSQFCFLIFLLSLDVWGQNQCWDKVKRRNNSWNIRDERKKSSKDEETLLKESVKRAPLELQGVFVSPLYLPLPSFRRISHFISPQAQQLPTQQECWCYQYVERSRTRTFLWRKYIVRYLPRDYKELKT